MFEANKIAVLGTGSWGTALADHLRKAGHEVIIWGRTPETVLEINAQLTNARYFPDEKLSDGLSATLALEEAIADASTVVVAVPSSAVRELASRLRGNLLPGSLIVSAAKGLEDNTLRTMTEVLSAEVPNMKVAVLSGPSFAAEVLRGKPTAVTIASSDAEAAQRGAAIFHGKTFRVYTSHDVVGVQLGGAIKNVIAIGVGVVDGVGMGANARAALITRGLAEMQRLIVSFGGNPLTVTGLSGLGDLLLTATTDLSRNRRVGLQLAEGRSLEVILAALGQVAEGVETAAKVVALAAKGSVEMPIAEAVNRVLTGSFTVERAVRELLGRARKTETR